MTDEILEVSCCHIIYCQVGFGGAVNPIRSLLTSRPKAQEERHPLPPEPNPQTPVPAPLTITVLSVETPSSVLSAHTAQESPSLIEIEDSTQTPQATEASVPPTAPVSQPLPPLPPPVNPTPNPLLPPSPPPPGSPIVTDKDMEAINNLIQQLQTQQN
ncbi:hypothetical protein VKT23_012197 [Stygiomarasmius scandens]|uniref:Uncharacterized protein n=1 Tax=Marasmiellus scandens TaxID=2682957 RepID=A0ABR1J8V3_9AGAR